jgi:hypothetical protein
MEDEACSNNNGGESALCSKGASFIKSDLSPVNWHWQRIAHATSSSSS